MKDNRMYIISLSIIILILVLCITNYYIKKKEKFNQDTELLSICPKDTLDKYIKGFYTNLLDVNKSERERLESLHKYEKINEEFEEKRRKLINSEQQLKSCFSDY